ncbi:hypothetical protein [Saccharibacillus kuerlensis]|uniref:DUF2975 domain-containing protein n=1 Tax=Saccharibacillus kuerlensis TaxID=459527 RepID=A0ABQ2L2X5_9BACL|nr:hypothetical protein [Saccharibacillus kuerlensis]GGO00625.1 hypothetical protein GCM10010969_22030 [Saccharibacillus kuerlensis]
MKSGFRLIFYGQLIVLIDLRIPGSLDLLADPIGYLITFWGMHNLHRQIVLFRGARWIALLAALLSIPEMLKPSAISPFGLPNERLDGWWQHAGVEALNGFVSLLLIYTLCEGVCRLAISQSQVRLTNRLRGAWKLYFVCRAAGLFLLPFSINFGADSFATLLIVLGIVALIGMIWILRSLLQAGNELKPVSTA